MAAVIYVSPPPLNLFLKLKLIYPSLKLSQCMHLYQPLMKVVDGHLIINFIINQGGWSTSWVVLQYEESHTHHHGIQCFPQTVSPPCPVRLICLFAGGQMA